MQKKAYDIARKKVFFCFANDTVPKVADFMQKNNIGSVMIKNKMGKVMGIITVGDILREVAKRTNLSKTEAGSVMSSPVISIHKDTSLDELIRKFKEKNVTRMLLVNDAGEYVGVVRDIAAYKYLSFVKFDQEAKKRFGASYFNKLY